MGQVDLCVRGGLSLDSRDTVGAVVIEAIGCQGLTPGAAAIEAPRVCCAVMV